MNASVGRQLHDDTNEQRTSMSILWLKVGFVTAGFLSMIIWVAWWARGAEEEE